MESPQRLRLSASGSILVPLANLNGSDRNSVSRAGVQGPAFALHERRGIGESVRCDWSVEQIGQRRREIGRVGWSKMMAVKAGILEDGVVTVDDRGTGQGSVISKTSG